MHAPWILGLQARHLLVPLLVGTGWLGCAEGEPGTLADDGAAAPGEPSGEGEGEGEPGGEGEGEPGGEGEGQPGGEGEGEPGGEGEGEPDGEGEGEPSADPAPDPECDLDGCLLSADKVGDYPVAALAPFLEPDVHIDNGYTVWTVRHRTDGAESLAAITVPLPVDPPEGGYGVVANNHGTTGLDDPCALTGTVFGAALSGLFGARGAIGVATDELVAELRAGGMEVEYTVVAGGGHADAAFGFVAEAEKATVESVSWVLDHLFGPAQ